VRGGGCRHVARGAGPLRTSASSRMPCRERGISSRPRNVSSKKGLKWEQGGETRGWRPRSTDSSRGLKVRGACRVRAVGIVARACARVLAKRVRACVYVGVNVGSSDVGAAHGRPRDGCELTCAGHAGGCAMRGRPLRRLLCPPPESGALCLAALCRRPQHLAAVGRQRRDEFIQRLGHTGGRRGVAVRGSALFCGLG
jgi:hypothetical protein